MDGSWSLSRGTSRSVRANFDLAFDRFSLPRISIYSHYPRPISRVDIDSARDSLRRGFTIITQKECPLIIQPSNRALSQWTVRQSRTQQNSTLCVYSLPPR